MSIEHVFNIHSDRIFTLLDHYCKTLNTVLNCDTKKRLIATNATQNYHGK